MYPAGAKLYLSPFSDPEYYASKIDFWKDVFGIDMSALIPFAKQCTLVGSAVDSIKAENVVCKPVVIKTIDCLTVQAQDLDLTDSNFSFQFDCACNFHGFAGWFDVTFRPSRSYDLEQCRRPDEIVDENANVEEKREERAGRTVVLSTAPEVGYTHWHQTLFPFEEQLLVEKGQELDGKIVIKPKVDAPRHLFITLDYSTNGNTYSHSYDF